MTQDSETLGLLEDLIGQALRAGASAADAVAVDSVSTAVSWRNGRLEDVEGSEGEDIGLRVFFGHRQAVASTSDRRADSLNDLVERTVTMAKAVPEDPYCGLAPEERLFKAPLPELDLRDDTDISPETLKTLAARAEDAARAVEGVTNAEGAGASAGRGRVSLVTSHGVAATYGGTSFSVSVAAVAGSGTGMERDYDMSSARFLADLEDAAHVGTRAGERAVRRLNPTKPESAAMPVVFDPRAAATLLGHFAGAISGASVARGTSFLKDRMGETVFAPGITIIDDPLRKRGLRSRPIDGEGVGVRTTRLIDDGVLTGWLLNSATARQLGLEVTGHATRGTGGPPGAGTSNLYMAAGPQSPEALIGDIADGFYVTELIGMGVNPVTGDYSRGAAGFRILQGELAGAVSEVTIAGTLQAMFREMTPASDLEFRTSINAPTVRVDGMTVAGA